MENKYIKDFFEDGNNQFNDIIQNDNDDYPMKTRLSSCFHILSSIINDPSVSSEMKSKALAMWSATMEENEKKMLPEHISQNDKYLTSYILDVDGQNNANILDLASSDHHKFELLESAKRQIAIGDFDTVVAATRAYSSEYNNLLRFSEIEDPNSIGDGHIGESIVTQDSLAKSTLSSNNSDLLNSMTNEDRTLMLKNYVLLNDFAQDGNFNLDSESLNEMSSVSEHINDHIKNLSLSSNADIDSPIAFDPNKPADLKEENDSPTKDDFSDTAPEIDINFKDEIKRQKAALMEKMNLIQLNKIPLISANVYEYDKDVYDEGLFKSNVGRGTPIMRINKLTGTSTIPPGSFGKSEAFDLAVMNLVLKGKKNIYLTPPRNGGLNAKKMFLEAAIKSAIEVGEFDPSKIHVPKAFRKFKDTYIATLIGGSISDKMDRKDANFKHDNEQENNEEIEHDDASLDKINQKDQLQETSKQKDLPSKSKQDAPINSEDAPINSEDAPINSEDAPINSEDAPTNSEDAPTNSEDAPINSAVAPESESLEFPQFIPESHDNEGYWASQNYSPSEEELNQYQEQQQAEMDGQNYSEQNIQNDDGKNQVIIDNGFEVDKDSVDECVAINEDDTALFNILGENPATSENDLLSLKEKAAGIPTQSRTGNKNSASPT